MWLQSLSLCCGDLATAVITVIELPVYSGNGCGCQHHYNLNALRAEGEGGF